MLFGWHKNLRHLTPNITSCYSHKMAIVSCIVSGKLTFISFQNKKKTELLLLVHVMLLLNHIWKVNYEHRFFHFYRAMLCISGTSHGPVSVRLSVTSGSSSKMAKRRITRTTPIVQGLEDLHEIRPGSPPAGAPNAGGVGQNRRLSTNNRLYLENGTSKTVSIKVE